MLKHLFLLFLSLCTLWSCAQQKQWVQYNGSAAPGNGKHIVFISGDEEYRSEQALPMLAQIISKKYGFKCTVLFAIDPSTGAIDPAYLSNIPGLENLATADLMFIFTRFRELPDEQMKYIEDYLNQGKPVIGIRTATHAFAFKKNKSSAFAKYDFESKTAGWELGFGKKILGETWVSHHGDHGKEGTRGLINGIEQNEKNTILNGVKDIWCASDVYTVKQLPEDSRVVVYGQATKGMTPASLPNLEKSVMPVAWMGTYTADSGKKGKVFTSTMGASIDLINEDLRRMFVNAAFWALDMADKTPAKANVDYVSDYKPTMFGFGAYEKRVLPSRYEMK